MDAAPTCCRRINVDVTLCFLFEGAINCLISFNLARGYRFLIVFQFYKGGTYFATLLRPASTVRRSFNPKGNPVTCTNLFIALRQNPYTGRVQYCVQQVCDQVLVRIK